MAAQALELERAKEHLKKTAWTVQARGVMSARAGVPQSRATPSLSCVSSCVYGCLQAEFCVRGLTELQEGKPITSMKYSPPPEK